MKNIVCAEILAKNRHLKYLKELRILSKINRNNSTKAESKIWYEFLKDKPINYKFTRQKPLNRFILDFYCSELLLAIEIDGESHNEKKNYDLKRDEYLNCLSIKTIRLTNDEVLNNLEKVKLEIIKIIQERKASLSREVLSETKRKV